jgi:hypothetical protein
LPHGAPSGRFLAGTDPSMVRYCGGWDLERMASRKKMDSMGHEPTGATGEIAGHLHPKARVSTRGRSMERRCFACDGELAVMPSFGAYTGGLSIRDEVFSKIFGTPGFMAHVLGDRKLHSIAASRCY